MRKLILVKHSLPELVAAKPARDWVLAEEGRRRCDLLAASLREYTPEIVLASAEPKATETGRLVAQALGCPLEVAAGLHEHERDNAGFLSNEDFQRAIADFFAKPDQLVFGRESADQARARFTQALARVLDTYQNGNIVVVAHGTVISLFVAASAGTDPLALWRRLGLPSFVVLSLPHLQLLKVADHST